MGPLKKMRVVRQVNHERVTDENYKQVGLLARCRAFFVTPGSTHSTLSAQMRLHLFLYFLQRGSHYTGLQRETCGSTVVWLSFLDLHARVDLGLQGLVSGNIRYHSSLTSAWILNGIGQDSD